MTRTTPELATCVYKIGPRWMRATFLTYMFMDDNNASGTGININE